VVEKLTKPASVFYITDRLFYKTSEAIRSVFPRWTPYPKDNIIRFKRVVEGSEKMAKEVVFLVEQCPGGGYTAKAFGHDIFTEADTLKELRTNVKDAVRCHFEESDKPASIRLRIVKDEVFPA
jgi:hypothetical protein